MYQKNKQSSENSLRTIRNGSRNVRSSSRPMIRRRTAWARPRWCTQWGWPRSSRNIRRAAAGTSEIRFFTPRPASFLIAKSTGRCSAVPSKTRAVKNSAVTIYLCREHQERLLPGYLYEAQPLHHKSQTRENPSRGTTRAQTLREYPLELQNHSPLEVCRQTQRSNP